MPTVRDIVWSYIKALWPIVLTFFGVPSFAGWVAVVLGLSSGLLTVENVTWFVSSFAMPYTAVASLLAGGYAAVTCCQKGFDRMRLDFYSENIDARIDRGYRIFSRLFRKSNSCTTPEQRQQWDQDVRRALSEHCLEEQFNLYLLNTGRIERITAIDDKQWEEAVGFVRRLVQNELNGSIKGCHYRS